MANLGYVGNRTKSKAQWLLDKGTRTRLAKQPAE
jgi:hypothetical protein